MEFIMNRKAIVTSIIAMSLTTAGIAFAQERNDRGRNEQAQQQEQERGAGPNHSYHRGDRLPAEEHNSRYVVNDWRSRNLREPPNGYHWVQSGNDYVLAAIATGVIADLLLSR
jgi:Ni/Co efflux regulator RcnB